MKRLTLLLTFVFSLVVTINAQTMNDNQYSGLWEKVAKAEKDGKPQTAVTYLKQIESAAQKTGNQLEQLYASEAIYDRLREYNWKEAGKYYPVFDSLRNEMYSSLEANIEKYQGNPKVAMLIYENARRKRQEIDRSDTKSAKEYLELKQYCQEAIAKYHNESRYVPYLKELVNQMDSQAMNVSGVDGQILPTKDIVWKISGKNIAEVKVDIYRLEDNYLLSGYSEQAVKAVQKHSEKVASLSFSDFKNEYNIYESKEIKTDLTREGIYILYFDAGNVKVLKDLNVCSVAAGLRFRGDGAEFYAANLLTGEPYSNPSVSLFRHSDRENLKGVLKLKPKSTKTYKADGFTRLQLPEVDIKDVYQYSIRVEDGNNIYSPLVGLQRFNTVYEDVSAEYADMVIFTDRTLYKPTDTIFFKIICYKSNGEKGKVLANAPVELTFRHQSSGDTISSVKLVTNDMGSASGYFFIPEGSKNGRYIIQDKNYNSCAISVEEYKRPTFSVRLISSSEVYGFNDVIKQEGKIDNYAGFSVANAVVEYEVYRSPFYNDFRHIYYFGREKVFSGKVLSDNDGRFELNFVAKRPAIEDEKANDGEIVSAAYNVMVKVTDPQGETHETQISVPVSDIPLRSSVDFKQSTQWHKSTLLTEKDTLREFTINVTSLYGAPYSVDGKYIVRKDSTVIDTGSFHSNTAVKYDFAQLPSGCYKISSEFEYRGKKIESVEEIILFSTEDKKVPVEAKWFYYPVKTVNGIEFMLGTSEDDLYLEMELFDNDKCHYRKALHLQNEMIRISLPYKDEYRSSIQLSLFGFRGGEAIDRQYQFTRPNDTKIALAIESFKDKTTPNTEETFIIKAPASEAMVSIYDITSDRMGCNSFHFSPLMDVIYTNCPNVITTLRPIRRYLIRGLGTKSMSAGLAVTQNSSTSDMAVEEEMVQYDSAPVLSEMAVAGKVETMDAMAEDAVQEPFIPRSDFSELIAFYPHIRISEDGKAEIKYKTNDLLSTYKVLVMAHTRDLKSGMEIKSFVVQKELMVVPNIPLFVREGDKIILKSKVVNLSNVEKKGTAHIELYDDATKEILKVKGTDDVRLDLLAGSQGEVAWSIDVPTTTSKGETISKLGVKIVFRAGNTSDGEQHLITIIPSQITITEAASFVMGGRHGHKYYEKQLRNRIGAKNPTIEYAEYSTLSAVKESLPMAVKPESDNAIAWITALYINQMREKILSISKGETIDNSKSEAFRSEAVAKLKTLQREDGGFTWFNGMKSSDMITLFFLEKMNQLKSVGAITFNEQEQKLIEGAVAYTDARISEIHNYDRKPAYFSMIQYFAVRSEYLEIPLSKDADKAFRSYLDNTADKWQKLPILLKGQLCSTLLRCGDTQYWQKSFKERISFLAASLSDYAVENNTAGCYFPNAVMPYRGLMNSEIYAHSQLIDLFSHLGNKKMVEGIATWLLLQKHNQAWENTVATTDAVHALISSNAKDLKLGAVYYTYTTKMEQVVPSSNEISIEREFTRASDGQIIKDGDLLSVGDEIIAKYKIENSENRSFVEMQAMRPACFYPENERSGYSWGGYYREVKSSQTNYYYELLPEGKTVIEERFYVTQVGRFSSALVQIESLYAKEYRGHTGSATITTKGVSE